MLNNQHVLIVVGGAGTADCGNEKSVKEERENFESNSRSA